MRPIVVPLILVAALGGAAAHAQAVDPYARYGTAPPAGAYGQQGYAPGSDDPDGGYGDQGYGDPRYGDPAPPPADYGNAPPPGGTTYRDDERWSGGDGYGTADARRDADPANGWQGRGGPAPGARAQNPRTRAYAERVARWRARADACEAGDLRACQGPDR